jgi:hypothetical protein
VHVDSIAASTSDLNHWPQAYLQDVRWRLV